MGNLAYFIKESLINFKRNWSTSIGGVITIFLSLLIIGVFMVASLMASSVVQSVEDRVTIRVFIADNAAQADIDSLTADIKSMDYVANVSFTTKDQALEEYQSSTNADDQVIKQLQSDNPLPASLDVDLTDSSQVTAVANEIAQNATFLRICDMPSDPTQSIQYAQETVERLITITSYLRYIAIAVVALLVFVALIFINNTIRLAIMNRRREIGIMRLVGASNSFIRGPFVRRAVGIGLLASVLACAALGAIYYALFLYEPEILSFLTWDVLAITAGVVFVFGIAITAFCATISVNKFLRMKAGELYKI